MTNKSYETFFAVLSGQRRLEILKYLQTAGPQSVTDIAAGTRLEQSAVSHALNKLLSCEFVHIEIRGKHRVYSLNKDTIVPLLRLIDKHIEIFCSSACCDCDTARSLASKQESAAMM